MINESSVVIVLVAVLAVAFLYLAAKLIRFITRFDSETEHILAKMRHASDDTEYRTYRRELSCHYLCLIPFVTKRNAPRLYQLLFYRARYAVKEERCDGSAHILAPSVVGACLCVVCLIGTSWAWFTASSDAAFSGISAAEYTVSMQVMQGDLPVVPEKGTNGEWIVPLTAGQEYRVTLTPDGTAGKGFCSIFFEDKYYYTEQLTTGSLSFSVYASKDSDLIVTPNWGEAGKQQNEENTVDGSKPLGTKPTVLPPDSTTDSLPLPEETSDQSGTVTSGAGTSTEPVSEGTQEPEETSSVETAEQTSVDSESESGGSTEEKTSSLPADTEPTEPESTGI